MRRDGVGDHLLVTGGTGFIGRRLLPRLLAHGASMLVLGRSEPSFLTAAQARRVTFLRADLGAPRSLRPHAKAIQRAGAVFHLAASVPPTLDQHPNDLLRHQRENLQGTVHLLAALPQTLTWLGFLSSIDVYGPPKARPISERDPTRPCTYYGASKLAAETVLRIYGAAMHTPVAILRVAQVYGPGDPSTKAIPTFIRAALRGQAPVIYGTGLEQRGYIYVDDVVDATVRAWSTRTAGTFNIGGSDQIRIRELAATISRLVGSPHQLHRMRRASPAVSLLLDITRARRELGFRPRVGLEEGLRRTIAWFRDSGHPAPHRRHGAPRA